MCKMIFAQLAKIGPKPGQTFTRAEIQEIRLGLKIPGFYWFFDSFGSEQSCMVSKRSWDQKSSHIPSLQCWPKVPGPNLARNGILGSILPYFPVKYRKFLPDADENY